MAATWSDVPPELVECVARALLRSCYTDVHRWRTTPRAQLKAERFWEPRAVSAGSVSVLDLGLVDAHTWAAAAPASLVCRQLRRALLAAVGGLVLRVPTLVTAEEYVAMEDALPYPWGLPAGSHADRYWTAWKFGIVGRFGRGGGGLGRWLYFFPAADDSRDRTASLAAFVRSCPQLRAVEVWDCFRGDNHGHSMFILRSPAKPATRCRAQGAAPLERRPPGSNTHTGATDSEAPLRLAVSQHVGCLLGVYYDHSWGLLAPGVAAVAAAGGPVLHRRAAMIIGDGMGMAQDEQFGWWKWNETAWMMEGL